MPARKTPKASSPTPVDAITHTDKRTNLPTADAQDFMSPELEEPIPVRYPRDTTLDPQLVWRGKDELDGEDLVAEAPAIYIQEKINPQVLIENLRQTSTRREDEPELTLFDTFDGLPALDQIEFYQHESNWSNRMILGDSLNVMASLAEREALRGKVQMIYVDPPYGIKFGSNWQVSARKRDVKDGKVEDASREVEQIKAFRDTWELGIHSYLTYLRDRLQVARELLTESGSCFVQIGDENVHLVRAAGIQNGRKGERLEFDSIEPYAASYIQALGHREEATDGTPRRVGITIGPQYGTVGPGFIKDAAREANKAADLDLLCVLAFAFDPAVLGQSEDYVASDEGFANVAAERRLGKVPVLLIRMNADLVMGEELKKTGAGNLFTVFGEPDIEVKEEGDELRVVLHGVDVYDPNTGEIRSNDTGQIALWMIDTAYNEESFFVRHCYFTGGQDPFARLKRALKADIDEEAWASLYRTESRPFPRPETGKIAVKVINDYGDEVVKVFAV